MILRKMPKISYKFTIPQDSYEAFRDDISKIASGINFEEVEFNDEAKTALFKCNAYDLLRLFETELRAQEKDKNYPFFVALLTNFLIAKGWRMAKILISLPLRSVKRKFMKG
jgi:hypothetical protein